MSSRIKLATEIRWQNPTFTMPLERIKKSEQWGYDVVFAAEGYGNDALTPLAYVAGHTQRLKLGTCIAQVTSRAPASLAMSFRTMDALAGGNRTIVGLGSSSPVASEALYGNAWGSPYHRMRDYVAIMRQAFTNQPLSYSGRQLSVPYNGPDAKKIPAMPLMIDPDPIPPIVLAAATPLMIRQTAEIADGWFPVNYAPGIFHHVQPILEDGFARAGNGKSLKDFDIWVHVDFIVSDDVREAMRPFKSYVATYAQLQSEQMRWRGYDDLADRLTELVQAGRMEEAINAVPDEYIDGGWLVGPIKRIVKNLEPWLDCGATGLIVRDGPQIGPYYGAENLDAFEAIARAVGASGNA